MFYEVQIPAAGGRSMRSMQIEASSWRDAWATGLAQADGAPAGSLEWSYVDIRRDRVVVTDKVSRRQVHVAPVDAARVRQSQVLRVFTEPPVRDRKAARDKSVGFTDRQTGAFRTIGATDIDRAASDTGIVGRVVADTEQPAPPPQEHDSVVTEVPDAVAPREDIKLSETALEDVFLEITALFEPGFQMEDAIDFSLEMALKYVPSAAGGLLFASDDADHLYFASCRGEARKKFLKAELSIRDGLPARSLKGGIAIAVSDPARDPRHTPELAAVSGMEIRSICVAPIQVGDRAFGVLLLLNREDRTFFSQYDANILTYVGTQMGKYIQEQLDAGPLD